MTDRVFITQEMPQLNYMAAEEFGQIEFLTRNDWSPIAASLNNEQLLADVRTKLADYSADRDHIVVSGSPVVAAVVFMVLARITRRVSILKYSNRDQRYTKLLIEV